MWVVLYLLIQFFHVIILTILFFLSSFFFFTSQGQATDIQIQAEEIMKIKKQINQLFVKHTGKDLDLIERSMERDKFMSPSEAKDFGLIDKILEHPPKHQHSANKEEANPWKNLPIFEDAMEKHEVIHLYFSVRPFQVEA